MRRKEFKVFDKYTYLSTQGGGPIPNSLRGEVNKLLLEQSSFGMEISSRWNKKVSQARQLFAKSVNSNSDNVAFIPSTSYAMNALAYALKDKNNEVLTFEDDFPNSSLPWLNLSYKVGFVASDKNGYISFESIKKAIHSDTKILITSHVMYRTGFRQNIKEIGKLCKEKNIIFILDATQSYGVFPIDVNTCHIDVLVFHAYKWLNVGYGIGGMHLSDMILNRYPKSFLGFRSVNYKGEKEHDTLNFEVKREAAAYEMGMSPYLNILMFGYMLRFIKDLGQKKITKKVRRLVKFCLEQCDKNGIPVFSDFPKKNLSGIVNISAFGITKEMLKQEGIIARANGNKITIGIHYYNSRKDVKRLVEFIAKYKALSMQN